MTKEVYKSARGKTVDMGALRLKNEQERAVGNMNVNARGDNFDDKNWQIESRKKQESNKYKENKQKFRELVNQLKDP